MIERGRVLGFRFDGREYQGHPGDTLASALLANGVRVVARSFKYHRPRGIMTAGIEEPSALVRLETGAFAEPNRRPTDILLYDGLRAASQHAWPGLGFDVAALADRFAPLLPAGFYYKTFMGARIAALWTALWEPLLRRMAGLGRAPAAAGPVALRQAPRALRRAGGRRRAGRAERGAGCRSARRAGDPRRQRHRVRRRAACAVRRGSARPTARHGRAARSPNSARCRKCGCCPRRRCSAITTTTT